MDNKRRGYQKQEGDQWFMIGLLAILAILVLSGLAAFGVL